MADAAAPAISGNQYSEAQHFALLKSAVDQETSSLTAEKSELQGRIEALESEKAAQATELSEAKTKIDLLESDKVTAEAAAESARKELADFKDFLQKKEDTEKKKAGRTDRVKAANEHLTDGYFSDERVQRWAEMSDEDFNALVNEMTEFAAAAKPAGKDDKSKDDAKDAKDSKESVADKARESAAFTGGANTHESNGSQGVSTLGLLLAKRHDAGRASA